MVWHLNLAILVGDRGSGDTDKAPHWMQRFGRRTQDGYLPSNLREAASGLDQSGKRQLACKLGHVEGAANREAAAIEDVRVNLGRGDVLVSEQFLDSTDVVTGFQDVGCKTVPERVRGCALLNLCASQRALELALQARVIDVVAPEDA